MTEPRDEPAFSSTDGLHAWMGRNCRACLNDPGESCPLLAAAFAGLTPAEWVDGPDYRCTDRRTADGGGEPTPIPDPPGQDCMWPRDQFAGVRMLTAWPTPVEVTP